MIFPESLQANLAAFAFNVDRVYRYRHVRHKASAIVEHGGIVYAWVPSKDQRFLPVVFEFVPLKGGNKLKCFGVGRAERYGHIFNHGCAEFSGKIP